MNDTTQNFLEIFENRDTLKPVLPTYRLYYDEEGNPLFFSMTAEDGNYIDIDKETYTAMPSNVRVVDGKLKFLDKGGVTRKLVPSDDGTPCFSENVCIVVDETEPHIKWNIKNYE